VEGARSNILDNQCSNETKDDRWQRLMTTAQQISAEKLRSKIGSLQDVIVDEVDTDGAICRTQGDAPEIDGNLFIDVDFENLIQGDILQVVVEDSSEYDLWGRPTKI
jgi:ribosomal protein S12 methylthiotransferase